MIHTSSCTKIIIHGWLCSARQLSNGDTAETAAADRTKGQKDRGQKPHIQERTILAPTWIARVVQHLNVFANGRSWITARIGSDNVRGIINDVLDDWSVGGGTRPVSVAICGTRRSAAVPRDDGPCHG